MINPVWNAKEDRLRALWRLLLQAFLLLLAIYAAGSLLPLDLSDPPAVALAALAGTAVSVYGAGYLLDRRPFADFGFHLGRRWWQDFAFGLGLGFGLMAAVFLLELALGWIRIEGTFVTQIPEQPFLLALLTPLFVFVCVGIYEELLSRGYHLTNLAEGLNLTRVGPRGAVVLAWVLSSALFGLAHATNPNASLVSTFNIMLAGLFLGLGYVLTGELALPIGLHITWNFAQGTVFGFPVSGTEHFATAQFIATEQGGPVLWTGGAFGPEAGLLGPIAMLAGALLTVAWVRYRHGRPTLRLEIAEYREERMVSSE